MELKYSYLSSAGLRERNEDFVGFWQPDSESEWRSRGAAMAIADGVGGQGDGDIASRIAINVALRTFQDAPSDTSPGALLRKMFDAANIAVYDAGVELAAQNKSALRMATTLTICVLRHNQAHVGHVGDCRLYHIRSSQITRITSDHSEAASSEIRCVLTRSVGQDPFVRIDTHTLQVNPGDFLIQCSDGLHRCISEEEICNIVTRWPEQAIPELRHLCERRKTDDNFSAQILQILGVERMGSFRGTTFFSKVGPRPANDIQAIRPSTTANLPIPQHRK